MTTTAARAGLDWTEEEDIAAFLERPLSGVKDRLGRLHSDTRMFMGARVEPPAPQPPPAACRCGMRTCRLWGERINGEGSERVAIVRSACGREYYGPGGDEGIRWLYGFEEQREVKPMVTATEAATVTRQATYGNRDAAIAGTTARIGASLARRGDRPVNAVLREHAADLQALMDLNLTQGGIAQRLGLERVSGQSQISQAVRQWRKQAATAPIHSNSSELELPEDFGKPDPMPEAAAEFGRAFEGTVRTSGDAEATRVHIPMHPNANRPRPQPSGNSGELVSNMQILHITPLLVRPITLDEFGRVREGRDPGKMAPYETVLLAIPTGTAAVIRHDGVDCQVRKPEGRRCSLANLAKRLNERAPQTGRRYRIAHIQGDTSVIAVAVVAVATGQRRAA